MKIGKITVAFTIEYFRFLIAILFLIKNNLTMTTHLIIIAGCLLILVSPVSVEAQPDQKYGYSQHHHKSLRYGLFKPHAYDAEKSYPLIVYLHGSRDTVSRDLIWYQDAVQKETPMFVLTPKCEISDQGWGNTWHDGHNITTLKTLELIDSIVDKFSIDRNRLYIYGISMGGFGVFSILAKEKGKFAGAYAVCGGSDVKAAPKLLGTPLWIFHGEDDDVVPVRLSRDVYKEMIRLGGKKVKYTEYPGVKHNSWENVSREESLIPWLLAQQKNDVK
jgi:predicted peptidase